MQGKNKPITLLEYAALHATSGDKKIIDKFTKPLGYPFTDIPMEFTMTGTNEATDQKARPYSEKLLADRRITHGSFNDHARCTQNLKAVMDNEIYRRAERGQPPLTDTQAEAVAMILHKLGRIVAGDAFFIDHWDDIAGYAEIANGVDKPPEL